MTCENTWWDVLLFRRRACWETRWSLDEAEEALRDRTRPHSHLAGLSMWGNPDLPRPWMGSVGRAAFELELVRWFRNSYRPVARGTLEARGPRAWVTVELAPHMLARLFVLAPLAMAVLGAAAARDPAALGVAIGAPMFWLFGQLCFRMELGHTERMLRKELPEWTAPRQGASRDEAPG